MTTTNKVVRIAPQTIGIWNNISKAMAPPKISAKEVETEELKKRYQKEADEMHALQKQKEEEANRYAELKEEHRKLRDEHTTTYAELESRRTALEKELKQHEECLNQDQLINKLIM